MSYTAAGVILSGMDKLVRLAAKTLKKLFGQKFYNKTDVLGHTLEAWVAAAVNGFPGCRLKVIGVTGTNGKTTTVNFLANILQEAGYKPGVSTTANFRIGDEDWENDLNMTVTSPWRLQKLLKRMRSAQVDWAVLEVTSHALHQGRMAGVSFNIGVMTNLSPDHLDYHGSVENYAAAKAKLLRRAKKAVVLNHDDDWYEYFRERAQHAVYTYGLHEDASVRCDRTKLRADGSKIRIRYGERVLHADLHLPGQFNVYNALAAATVAFGLEIEWQAVQSGLEGLEGVPGRMEPVHAGQKFSVIIDYAHTPDAFVNVLKSIKPLTKGRVIVVFGGAPTHDYKELGSAAGKLADVAIITDDEPMHKDPQEIRRIIVESAQESGHARVDEVADRREGMARAFAMAGPKDTVMLLGLGHQKHRRVGGERIEWSEKDVARELLHENSANTTIKSKKR